VTVSIDSTGLPVGTHEAVLCIRSNHPVTPTVEVPVTVTVVEDDPDPEPPGSATRRSSG
jgi:hypothetical protein